MTIFSNNNKRLFKQPYLKLISIKLQHSSSLLLFLFNNLFNLLIVSIDIDLSFLLSELFGISEQLNSLFFQLLHLFKRRACLRIAFAVSVLIIEFNLFSQKIIFINHLWFIVNLLDHFLISGPSKDIIIVDSKGELVSHVNTDGLGLSFYILFNFMIFIASCKNAI